MTSLKKANYVTRSLWEDCLLKPLSLLKFLDNVCHISCKIYHYLHSILLVFPVGYLCCTLGHLVILWLRLHGTISSALSASNCFGDIQEWPVHHHHRANHGVQWCPNLQIKSEAGDWGILVIPLTCCHRSCSRILKITERMSLTRHYEDRCGESRGYERWRPALINSPVSTVYVYLS